MVAAGKTIHRLVTILTGWLLITQLPAQPVSIDFPVTENDTLHYKLQLVMDPDGQPSHFYREIFTPVCFTGECKPVYINFYWDLLGNYLRYDLPGREVLTKMDHDEFTEDDYAKLQEILANPSSLLGEIAIEDLVSTGTDNLADSVDAKTGATLKTIKREVIEGAVYTCYTLWHIAYGKIATGKMREVTESILTPELLHRFLQSNNHHYQYWAVDRVLDRDGFPEKEFEENLKKLVEGNNIFLSRNVLQRLNPAFFKPDPEQSWLLSLYHKKSYPMQLAILKRLESVPLRPATLLALSEAVPKSNMEQFGYILTLFTLQDGLPAGSQQILARLLTSLPEQKATKIYQLLSRLSVSDKEVQDSLKNYRASLK